MIGQQRGQQRTKRKANVVVRFWVACPELDDCHSLYVCGSLDELSQWNQKKAIKMTKTEDEATELEKVRNEERGRMDDDDDQFDDDDFDDEEWEDEDAEEELEKRSWWYADVQVQIADNDCPHFKLDYKYLIKDSLMRCLWERGGKRKLQIEKQLLISEEEDEITLVETRDTWQGKVPKRGTGEAISAIRKAIGDTTQIRSNRSATVASAQPFSHFLMQRSLQTVDDRVCKDVPKPEKSKLAKVHLFNRPNNMPNTELLRKHLLKEGRLENDAAKEIIRQATAIYRKEPNLLELKPPLNVCGDVHGQFYDLIQLLETGGAPSEHQYLFLGDYVDRGCFSTEVCFYMFALKITYPNSFFMLRGNHECRLLTTHFNFREECVFKYNEDIWDDFMECFDCLPIAATVQNNIGTFLCMHGGLSPSIEKISDIEPIDRFQEPPADGPLCDLLWSDPIEDNPEDDDDDMEAWDNIDYMENPTRGCGFVFGYKAVDDFLTDNNLISVIRAHEVQEEGYLLHNFRHDDREHPMVITVFSAPNYCDAYCNKAALLRFESNTYHFRQMYWTDHPFYLPNFMDGLSYSLPFIMENLTDLFLRIVEICEGMMPHTYDSMEDESEEEEGFHSKLSRVSKMMMMMKRVRSQNQTVIQSIAEDANITSKDPHLAFQQAKKRDAQADKARPTGGTRSRARTF